jgi:hypothetical protein
MIFRKALASLTASQRTGVRARLTTIAASGRVGSHVEQNLFTESRLPLASAVGILRSLLVCVCDFAELKKGYQQACHQHILKGPLMKGRRPRVLGRAIARGRLEDMLIKRGVFVSAASADAFFRRLRKMSLPKQKKRLHLIPLGNYVIWATFCAEDRGVNPFTRLPNNADQIQDVLGFPLESRGDDVFLFAYTAPRSVALLFPTVADAEWNDVFCPAPDDPSVEYGLTRPSQDEPHLACQPEVVHHDRVTCTCLVTPVTYLPAIMPSI